MRQGRNKKAGNRRRISQAAQIFLRGLESPVQVLSLNNVYRKFDQVVPCGPTRRERGLQIFHHLFRLCSKVSLTHDLALRINSVLPAYINGFPVSCCRHHLRKCRIL